MQNRGEKITTKELLKMIGLGALIIGSVVAPGLPMAFLSLGNNKKKPLNFNRRFLKMQIKRLVKRDVISVKEEEDFVTIRLTDKGREKILKYNFDELEIKKPKRWDGRWRMVIFDIPNEFKKARDIFREKLKFLGFYQLQESVFIYPFPCEKEVEFIREYLGIGPYVLFLIFKELEGKNLLPEQFSF